MRTLHLTLKKRWFDLIASGEKKEEYREIKAFWFNRLMTFEAEVEYDEPSTIAHLKGEVHFDDLWVTFKQWDTITFTNGYQKDAPKVTVEFKGMQISEGKESWGAAKGEKYIVLKIGNII